MSYTTPPRQPLPEPPAGLDAADWAVALRAFRAAGLAPSEFRYWAKPGPPTPIRSFAAATSVFTVAVTPRGCEQIRLEVAGRRWAEREGIPTPGVLATDPAGAWFLADLVPAAEPGGRDYVLAGLDVADRIAVASPPKLADTASQWQSSSRLGALRRSVRVSVGGLPPLRYRRARAAAAALPDVAWSHGDFYRRNVLRVTDPGSPGVATIDWEFMGYAPRFTDHLRFWSTLLDPADRRLAWSRITEPLTPAQRRHVATLANYLVLRLLGENLAAPAAQRNAVDLAHARRLARELPALPD